MTSNPSHFPTLTDELLQRGCRVRFRPTGNSMYPAIRDDDPVLVEPIEPQQIRPGDILLYRLDQRILAHRVVAIQAETFILRGDALQQCDPPVMASQILGRVVAVERAGQSIDLTHPWTQFRQQTWAWLRRLKHRITFLSRRRWQSSAAAC